MVTLKRLSATSEHLRNLNRIYSSKMSVNLRAASQREKEESLLAISAGGFLTWIKKRAATYSPARRSTIGVDGLNFSVRNGKRWNPAAVAT